MWHATHGQNGRVAMEIDDGAPDPETTPLPQLTVLRDPEQHMQALCCMSVSETGPLVAAGSLEGYLGIWNYETGELEHKEYVESEIWTVAINHDGTKVATGDGDGLGTIWDLREWYKMAVLCGHEADFNEIVCIAWSPDGKLIATGSADCTTYLWNAENGGLLQTFEPYEKGRGIAPIVDFSPDSSRLVTCEGALGRVWDTHSDVLLRTLSGHHPHEQIWSMSFSPDGKRIATCSDDGTTRTWRVETGDELVTFYEHRDSVNSATFSPDGEEIASGGIDMTVVICNSFSGARRLTFYEHRSVVNSVTYSHSGRLIASGSPGYSVKVWDTSTGHTLAELGADEVKAGDVAFSWDDQVILLLDRDDSSIRVLRLCDASNP